MTDAGYRFDVVPPHDSVECGVCSTGGPASLVRELALSKALNVAAQLKKRGELTPEVVIVACDTLAECRGEVLGKPADEAHARSMLERLRGNLHRCYSGLCVWQPLADGELGQPAVRLATTELRMDPIADAELDAYLATGLWEGKAGAFGYQDGFDWLHITAGSESNVIGLPMELLAEMLPRHDSKNASSP
jgi:septum formation protein